MATLCTTTGRTTQAKKSCTSCRILKIACDKALPECTACKMRGKTCSGYSENLSWPRKGDKRRAAMANVQSRGRYRANPVVFLNTSSWDVSLYREHVDTGAHLQHMGAWTPPTISPRQSIWSSKLGFYGPQLPTAIRLVTSGQFHDDVCGLLYRMSLGDNTVPSLSLRHSMNAISLLSLHKSNEALRYKILAISYLKGALTQGLDNKSRPQAIATSLLLTLYEVLSQSGKTNDWSVYFEGCMKIVNSGFNIHRRYAGDCAILLNWVRYHKVLYKFSIKHWQQRTPQMEIMAKSDILVSDSANDIDLITMHNMLGCSPEVLDFLSEAMDLVKNRDDPNYLSLKRLRAINELELRLKQIDDLRDCFDVGADDITISKVSESMNDRLFQFALIIYVDRVVKGAFMSSTTSQSAAAKAFVLLEKIRLYDRPFPLFILSIQAETDEQRLLILTTIHRTSEARPMNNLGSTEEMIKKLWAQQDLQGPEQADALFLLNAVISASSMPPTFTSPFVINAITGANGVPFLSI
ncbi:fungal-specific transcription factor domain-containing protein [Trichoderma sp. SZMC 28011]